MESETVVITPRFDTERQGHGSSVVKSDDESLANLGTAHISAKPQLTVIDPSAITPKSIWSLSNEYLLIGVIIGLATIILVLIVYIVKIKQSTPQQTDATESPQQQLPDVAQLQQLENKPFIPRSQVKIEPIPDRDDIETFDAISGQRSDNSIDSRSNESRDYRSRQKPDRMSDERLDRMSRQKHDTSFEPRDDAPDDAENPHVADKSSPLFNMRGDATLDSIAYVSSSQPDVSQSSSEPNSAPVDQTSIQQMIPAAARKRRGRAPNAPDSGSK